MTTLGILASGRGTNGEAIIRATATGRLAARVAVVLSDRADAPVLARARAHGIEACFLDPGRPGGRLSPQAETAYVARLGEAGVEWVVLAGFMRILGKPLLSAYPGRIVNIHPSLLPSFPGLHAQRQAWTYGVKVSGCTVHLVDEGVDTGPIVHQLVVPVRDSDSPESLEERILHVEHEAYVDALRLLVSGRWRIEGRRVLRLEEGEDPP